MRIMALGVLLLSLVAGCVSTPSEPSIRSAYSEFDGAQEVAMEPAWVCKDVAPGGCSIKLGLYWRSTMLKDMVVLVALVSGEDAFRAGGSLHFDIDGRVVSFAQMDALTELHAVGGSPARGVYSPAGYAPELTIPPPDWSTGHYLFQKGILETVLNGQRVVVRVDLPTGHVEGLFSIDDAATARPGFRNFYQWVFGGPQTETK